MILTESQILQIINEETRRAVGITIREPIIVEYKVQSGDIFSKIAQKHGVSVSDLRAANPQIADPNKIQIGDQINIPGAKPTAGPVKQSGPPEPTFRPFEKEVGLEDEHEFSKRSAGELMTAGALYTFAKAMKPIAMAGPPGFSEPMKFFFSFMAIKKDVYNIKAPDLRRAMHYVCMSAQRRGSPKAINYVDYKNGQKLAGRKEPIPTFAVDGGSLQSVFSSDPFQQLSACFGNAEYAGNSQTGFTVTDSFNFNLDRDKSQVEKASEYIASIPGILALVGRLTGTDPGGRAVGEGFVGKIEEILVMYEHTLRYTGFPTMIKTIPAEASLSVVDRLRDMYS